MAESVPDASVPPSKGDWRIDARKLWIGGIMAGIVAAGVAIVGLLIARGIFDIRIFIRGEGGGVVSASLWWYAAVAFAAAILATGLLHLLLLAAPGPFRFFGWIVGLAIAIAVIVPFTTSAMLSNKVGTAAINLAIGIAATRSSRSAGAPQRTRIQRRHGATTVRPLVSSLASTRGCQCRPLRAHHQVLIDAPSAEDGPEQPDGKAAQERAHERVTDPQAVRIVSPRGPITRLPIERRCRPGDRR
jgi:hypothetical protein